MGSPGLHKIAKKSRNRMMAVTTGRQTSEQLRGADLVDLIGARVALKRKGQEYVGLCPFHSEKTPSFFVVPHKGFYHCFGCGAHGNAIDYCMDLLGLEFKDAIEHLIGETPTLAVHRPTPQRDDLATERDRQRRIACARGIFARGIPVSGTLAETYLKRRGITMPAPPTLRFCARLAHPTGVVAPALVAAVQQVDGHITAVWRIYLENSGDKALLENARLGLGLCAGGAVRLGPAAPRLALTEGIETGLAIQQAEPRLSVWAALSTGGLRTIELPAVVRDVVICRDRDAAGQAAAEAAATRLGQSGRRVEIAFPGGRNVPKGFDFNDLLLAGV